MKFKKKIAGFSILELLVALFVIISVSLLSINGLAEIQKERCWEEFLSSYEQQMKSWQIEAMNQQHSLLINYYTKENVLRGEIHTTTGWQPCGECVLPRHCHFSGGGKKPFLYNENGNFAYLFKIEFTNDDLKKTQRYSLLIGGGMKKY